LVSNIQCVANIRDWGLRILSQKPATTLTMRTFGTEPVADAMLAAIRSGERTARPLETNNFMARLEADLGRKPTRQNPGRKPTNAQSREK
jgi:hypothetical protein